MLDLTARYEPGQDAFSIKSVTASTNFRKPAEKNDSFNRILNKIRQRSQDLKPVNNEFDKSSDPIKLKNISARKTGLVNSEKSESIAPVDDNKSNCPCQSEPDQSVSENNRQATSQQDQDGANTENDAELLTAMSQPEYAAAEVLDQNSSVGWEASASSAASKNSTDTLIEVPLNETQPFTAVPARQANDVASQQVGLKVGMENAVSLTTQVQPIDTRPAAIPSQEMESNLATASREDIADLPKNQLNSAAIPVLVDGRAANDTVKGDLTFVARDLEMAATVSINSQPANDQDLPNPQSSTASGAEDAKSEKADKALNPEDIRFKLMARNLLDSKPDEKQSATDIKKILVSESQRLSAAKSVAEVGLTETPEAKSHEEMLPTTISGLEKVINTTGKTGLEAQTNVSQSAASNADPKDLIEQIVKKAEMLSKASNSEIKIQLKPEFMGKMIIKIAVEDGLVTAKFITESQHVKQLLEANLGSLRQSLESQGLRVDRTEVNVQLENGGSFHGDDSGRQQMWDEYADRNNYNRFDHSTGADYRPGDEAIWEPYTEITTVDPADLLADGKVDFMI